MNAYDIRVLAYKVIADLEEAGFVILELSCNSGDQIVSFHIMKDAIEINEKYNVFYASGTERASLIRDDLVKQWSEKRQQATVVLKIQKMSFAVDFRPHIEKVIFNNPATIVFWKDGSKTITKCGELDIYDPEKGLAMCFAKKLLGNEGNYYSIFTKWLPKEEEPDVEYGAPFEEPFRRIKNAFSTLGNGGN